MSTAAELAERLRALLAAIDAGEIDAEPTQRAYLAGALDVAEQLSAGSPVH